MAVQAAEERGPLVGAVGQTPLPGAATDGVPMTLVRLNTASVASLTSSLSAAEVFGAVYSAGVPGVAVIVAASKLPVPLAEPGIV
ncbi:hypothetical protein D3C72_977700 [compost metagenome]